LGIFHPAPDLVYKIYKGNLQGIAGIIYQTALNLHRFAWSVLGKNEPNIFPKWWLDGGLLWRIRNTKHFKQIQDLVGFHLSLLSFCERDDLFGTIPAFVSSRYFTQAQKEQPSINHSISHFQHKKCHQLCKEAVCLELSPATKAS